MSMLSPRLLNQQPNKAVEDKYSEHILYRFLTFVCDPIMSEAEEYAIYPGELFYNCVYCLDSLKGTTKDEAKEKCSTMYDEVARYFNDKGLDKNEPEVKHAICLVVFSLEYCLALTEPPTFTVPLGVLAMRLEEIDGEYSKTLRRRFAKASKVVGEQALKEVIRAYMQTPDLLSNEIGEVIDAADEDEKKLLLLKMQSGFPLLTEQCYREKKEGVVTEEFRAVCKGTAGALWQAIRTNEALEYVKAMHLQTSKIYRAFTDYFGELPYTERNFREARNKD